MKNMKIRVKLILGFMLVVALAIVIGLVGIFSLLSAKDDTALLNTRANIGIYANEALATISEQRVVARGAAFYVAVFDNDSAKAEIAKWTDYDAEYEQLMGLINASISTTVTRQKFDAITGPHQQYMEKRKVFQDIILQDYSGADTGHMEAALAQAMADFAPYITAVTDPLESLATFMSQETDEQAASADETANFVTAALIAVLVVSVIIAIILGLYLSGIIAAPINMMMGYLQQAGETGNLTFPEEELRKAREAAVFKDETSQSLAAFLKMLEQFIYYGDCLTTVANRDLSVAVKPLGDSDTCGVALKGMLSNLNAMFTEIRTSASQVSSGSGQIAQASQNLATGASEQAATIQEFTATVTEIQNMADSNTKTATTTLQDVHESSRVMVDCTNAMNQMLNAMRDIDDRSQSISKVIKVIDDIAFQTNILALNAAVEAARAGQHGKGFAVVADEVRNLASKSADAAKETAALIESSSQSVAEGNGIVTKVNESLQAVSTISDKNAQSIEKLHDASRQQSESMAEVTAAITQLSSVVQANSATAEETAASSQEMSAQAAVLNEIVARFKIASGAGNSAPAQSQSNYSDEGPSQGYSSSGFALSSGGDKY
ncbi:methyl-accepting chemotaxis protein [Clostridia bacterium]|nr:methyl-accepting chemotaxis protein [Clostridia bacterium]